MLNSGILTSTYHKTLFSNSSVLFVIIMSVPFTEPKLQHATIALTNSHIALLKESHQWPLSRLHPPPNQLPPQFCAQHLNKITDIVSMVIVLSILWFI